MTDHVIVTPTLQGSAYPPRVPIPPAIKISGDTPVAVESSKSDKVIGLVKKYKFYIILVVVVIVILVLCYKFASKDVGNSPVENAESGGKNKPNDNEVRKAAELIDSLDKSTKPDPKPAANKTESDTLLAADTKSVIVPAPSPASLEQETSKNEISAMHKGESDADFERRMLVTGKVDDFVDKL